MGWRERLSNYVHDMTQGVTPEAADATRSVMQGATSATVDVGCNWITFFLSRLKEGSNPTTGQLASGAPKIYSAIHHKGLLTTFRTVVPGYTFPGLMKELYSGSGRFLCKGYLPLVMSEFFVHGAAKRNGATEIQATIITAVTGALVAAPADTAMIQGTRYSWRQFGSFLLNTRGVTATTGREAYFVTASMSDLPEAAAQQVATYYHLPADSLWIKGTTVGTRTIILLPSQVCARIASTMQDRKDKPRISTITAISKLWKECGSAATHKYLSEAPTQTIARNLHRVYLFGFPGGAWRVLSLLGTSYVYDTVKPYFNPSPEQITP